MMIECRFCQTILSGSLLCTPARSSTEEKIRIGLIKAVGNGLGARPGRAGKAKDQSAIDKRQAPTALPCFAC